MTLSWGMMIPGKKYSCLYSKASPIALRSQVQGVLVQFSSVAVISIDISISLCYLLMLQWSWREVHLRQVEKWLHIVVWPVAFIPSVYLLVHRQYGKGLLVCWSAYCSDDEECLVQHRVANGVRTGTNSLGLFHAVFSLYVMARVYRFARSSNQETSRRVAQKGLCYAANIACVYLPYTLAALVSQVTNVHLDVFLLAASTIPLGGFLNMLVFMMYRPATRTMYGAVVREVLDWMRCCQTPESSMGESSEPSLEPCGSDLFATTAVDDPDSIRQTDAAVLTEQTAIER